ncbi:MAG: hypothetical protein K0S07_350 [Chlamydiales bacterium]|jgi:hypothetical protein|nr:hypothetical protein [Chlamydiales bacterium]
MWALFDSTRSLSWEICQGISSEPSRHLNQAGRSAYPIVLGALAVGATIYAIYRLANSIFSRREERFRVLEKRLSAIEERDLAVAGNQMKANAQLLEVHREVNEISKSTSKALLKTAKLKDDVKTLYGFTNNFIELLKEFREYMGRQSADLHGIDEQLKEIGRQQG